MERRREGLILGISIWKRQQFFMVSHGRHSAPAVFSEGTRATKAQRRYVPCSQSTGSEEHGIFQDSTPPQTITKSMQETILSWFSSCTFHSPCSQRKERLFLIKSFDCLVPSIGKLPQPVIRFSAELFCLIRRTEVVSVTIVSYVLYDGKDTEGQVRKPESFSWLHP